MISQIPTTHVFDQWASVYDLQANPLLALEARWLPHLLPVITGSHILDVGCGTGRWLRYLEPLAPASLAGCDLSAAMLAKARHKLSPQTTLHHCSTSSLPAAQSSLDLILTAFVQSYLEDLPAFALECSRVLRPGGHIVLSDMHPDTALRYGWKRGFCADEESVDVSARCRSIHQVTAAFTAAGFLQVELEAPPFAEPELFIFEQAGKLDDYLALLSVPAIYILSLQKQASSTTTPSSERSTLPAQLNTEQCIRLSGAPIAASESCWNHGPLTVQGGFISSTQTTAAAVLDLTGCVVLPGLINAHDHLEFSLFPNLGRSPDRPPYRNATEWALEIHNVHDAEIQKQRRVPLATRLWFGGIRNLLCGATTVCHHNSLYAEVCTPEFPVRIVKRFYWAHSLTFGEKLCQRSTTCPSSSPFIIHAGEGTDRSARHELQRLHRLNLLTHSTVLVHALAFRRKDMALLNACNASVILCPTSNHFLFGKSMDAMTIQSLQRVALGSDSPLTAVGDLMDELHFLASQTCVPPAVLYAMVTGHAASILHLEQGEGTTLAGSRADLIAVRSNGEQLPCDVVSSFTLADVELVVLAGNVHLASPALYHQLSLQTRVGMHCMEIVTPQAVIKRWISAPLPELFASAEQVLGAGRVRLGNKEVRYVSAC